MSHHISLTTPFPFGKYKGQPLQVALADADYMRWVMSQVDLTEKYPDLVNFLANGPLKGTQDTEQHNRMQVRLLDKSVVAGVLKSAFAQLSSAENLVVENVRFEVFNWDAVVAVTVGDGEEKTSHNIAIELKPTISEDYPAVLRQVANRVQVDRVSRRGGMYNAVLVLTDRIRAATATSSQIKQMFASSAIKLHEWSVVDDFDDLTPQFAIGDTVKHAKFGIGEVVAVGDDKIDGMGGRAQVKFGHVTRWLALSIARLEKVTAETSA